MEAIGSLFETDHDWEGGSGKSKCFPSLLLILCPAPKLPKLLETGGGTVGNSIFIL